MQRREVLQSLSAGAALAAGAAPLVSQAAEAAKPLQTLGKPQAFDYAWLKGQARTLASGAYLVPSHELPPTLRGLDFDRYQAMRYKPERTLWGDAGLEFSVRFFHLGLFFNDPVRMFEVVDGQSQEIAYDPKLFEFGKSGVKADKLPKDLGFAGFRLLFHTDGQRDFAAWLGASYFRAVGGDWQYGLSARGLAIDTGGVHGEEFPRFKAFWLERPKPDTSRLVIYALLDSPSVAGAYRFEVTPGATLTMDVDAALYPRRAIDRIGIAPGTSMYFVGENDRHLGNDFRPEIHDSDGLSIRSGSGEWIWRPLVDPPVIRINSFFDNNPRGWGLLQRDRDFDHYQDDGAYYDKRPSLWVEPKGDWGRGCVQLVELPTPDETNDNVVAYWNPEAKPQPGEELLYSYRLHWGRKLPVTPPLATVLSTRTGIGGVVGRKREYFSWRFAVDFVGGDLNLLAANTVVTPVITNSRGSLELVSVRPLSPVNGYRALFDLKLADDSVEPVDLRLFLRAGGQTLTETWLYQYTPPPADQRHF